MPDGDVQKALLVRAFEEADERGALVSFSEREVRAARARDQVDEASGGSPTPEDVVRAYAASIIELLRERVGRVDDLLAVTRPGRKLAWALILLALVVGLATSALGPERRINVLALPLLGLIVWNVGVVVFCVVSLLVGGRRSAPVAAPLAQAPRSSPTPTLEFDLAEGREASGPVRWIWRAALSGLSRLGKRIVALKQRDGVVVSEGAARFVSLWSTAMRPTTTLRIAATLHGAALAMVFGAVVGMYLRGIAFEYRATWESTFLQAGAVQSLLDALLALPSRVLGLEVPAVDLIEAPDGHGDANTWIHLYAMAAVLYVGIPRGILGLIQMLRARARETSLAVDTTSPWARRLIAPVAGSASSVDVVPYSYSPSPRVVDGLKALLHHAFGVRAEVTLRDPFDYGALLPDGWREVDSEGSGRTRVIVFSLSQSPESEVHAAFVDEARRSLADGERLVVVVDCSDFVRRVAAAGRDDERRRAWDGVMRDIGITCAHVQLDTGVSDDAVMAIAAATWPGGAA